MLQERESVNSITQFSQYSQQASPIHGQDYEVRHNLALKSQVHDEFSAKKEKLFCKSSSKYIPVNQSHNFTNNYSAVKVTAQNDSANTQCKVQDQTWKNANHTAVKQGPINALITNSSAVSKQNNKRMSTYLSNQQKSPETKLNLRYSRNMTNMSQLTQIECCDSESKEQIIDNIKRLKQRFESQQYSQRNITSSIHTQNEIVESSEYCSDSKYSNMENYSGHQTHSQKSLKLNSSRILKLDNSSQNISTASFVKSIEPLIETFIEKRLFAFEQKVLDFQNQLDFLRKSQDLKLELQSHQLNNQINEIRLSIQSMQNFSEQPDQIYIAQNYIPGEQNDLQPHQEQNSDDEQLEEHPQRQNSHLNDLHSESVLTSFNDYLVSRKKNPLNSNRKGNCTEPSNLIIDLNSQGNKLESNDYILSMSASHLQRNQTLSKGKSSYEAEENQTNQSKDNQVQRLQQLIDESLDTLDFDIEKYSLDQTNYNKTDHSILQYSATKRHSEKIESHSFRQIPEEDFLRCYKKNLKMRDTLVDKPLRIKEQAHFQLKREQNSHQENKENIKIINNQQHDNQSHNQNHVNDTRRQVQDYGYKVKPFTKEIKNETTSQDIAQMTYSHQFLDYSLYSKSSISPIQHEGDVQIYELSLSQLND